MQQLGADRVVDYTKNEPLPNALDAAFDTLGAASELASIAAVKRGGTIVGVGGMPDEAFTKAQRLPALLRAVIWLATTRRRQATARAGNRFVYLFMRPDGAQLAEIASWIDAGRLRPVVHRTYPLAEAREAFAELERGRTRGKIVVAI